MQHLKNFVGEVIHTVICAIGILTVNITRGIFDFLEGYEYMDKTIHLNIGSY